MTVLDLYDRARAGFGDRLRAVDDARWHLPTPCRNWDVRSLVHHLVYVQSWVPPLCQGLTIEQIGDRFEGDLLGGDPVGAWHESVGEALRAFAGPEVGGRTIHLAAYGTVSGEEFAYDMAMDLHVHTWDLARALGADEVLDPEVTAAVYEWLRSRNEWGDGFSLPVLRKAGFFDDELQPPAEAGTQIRMLALVGRRAFT